ncbi:Defensin-like protein 74 [Cardamine amara subsp. amara]|uniref:Defensin-like protein 74 n=1 Tax=Cardamine amara subsp. amara TaxID=228776 RepID=A0ABD1BCD5_CARAN
MNYKVGFMSLLVVTSVIFLFLLVPDKVEAEKDCIGVEPCKESWGCMAACITKGYKRGQCVGWDNPNICCCNNF